MKLKNNNNVTVLLLGIVMLLLLRIPLDVSAQTSTNADSIGDLDNPISGTILSGTYNVSGWFLDASGVASIEVLVDDTVVGQATYGDARIDILTAYPQFNNGSAGYHYSLDTTQFADGPHTVTIRGNGNNGHVNTIASSTVTIGNTNDYVDKPVNETKQTTLASNTVTIENTEDYVDKPVNETKQTTLTSNAVTIEKPRGYLDSPITGTTLTGNYNVSGWFLDASGVQSIEVFVDGSLVGQAIYGDARTDVLKAYPQFNNGNAGYHYALDTTQFADGPHTVTVKGKGKNGQVTTVANSSVTILNTRGYLDSPVSGTNLTGIQNVSGWFLDGSGVQSIEVLVDGNVVGQAVYGDSRPDVLKAYPQFKNGNAGYHYALDTTKIADGLHTVTVKGKGKNGQVTTVANSSVTILNTRGYLDSPVSGTTLTGIQNVSGWFLDGSGVQSIEVLVDGNVVGQAVYGDSRPDVLKAYPQFKNGDAGYHYALDTTKIADGPHTVTIRVTGKNGQVNTTASSNVTFKNVRGYMDSPVSGTKLTGTHTVSGWFLDASGVASIDVLVDDVVVGRATYGDSRPDVQMAYPQFKNGNAGYHYVLDTTKFTDGQHTVTIRETGKNGQVTTLASSTVTTENVRGYMDSPVSGTKLTGKHTVSGWFLDGSGVASIEVLVDDVVVGQATYGDSRSDVLKVYPQFKNGNAGYHYVLDSSQFADGQHTVTIKETSKNGHVTTLASSTVIFENIKWSLDNPLPGATLKGTQKIHGWFLDGSGVEKIEVLVDGNVIGQATYGDLRPDVLNVFPNFNNRNAGYHYTFDTTQFTNGQHTITIRETGKNGRVTTLPESSITIDNGKYVSAVKLAAYRSFDELADYNIHLPFYNPGYTRYFELSYGDRVNVLQEYQYASKIRTLDGREGWVHKDYLEDDLLEDFWLVKLGRNLRSDHSVNSTSIGYVPDGSKVKVLDYVKSNDSKYTEWYKIKTESGQVGWIWGAVWDDGVSGYNVIKYESSKEGSTTTDVSLFTPLTVKADVTADQINSFIDYKTGKRTTTMTQMGDAYLTAQQESGLNTVYLLAHSALETGWGTSPIVNNKYNYYGIGAIDSDPDGAAYSYSDQKGGIVAGAMWISDNYVVRASDNDNKFPLTPQPTIDNMRNDNSWHEYSEDESWAVKIVNIIKEFNKFLGF